MPTVPESRTFPPLRLPDFIIIGGMKCGSTALHHHVGRHPDIWINDRKELDFFVAEHGWDNGLGWYAEQFAHAPEGAQLAEDSPNYSKLPLFQGVPRRMKDTLPDVKLLYIIRHPIERMRSHWLHQRAEIRIKLSAEKAFRTSDDHLACSMYGMQLHAYLEVFDRSQIHVVVSEDLRRDPQAVAADVCAFLGADPARLPPPDDGARINRSEDKWLPRPGLEALYARAAGPRVPAALRARMRRLLGVPGTADAATISPDLEARLIERLQPDLETLRGILGPDFHAWGLLDEPAVSIR